jgi:hypothetical protein
MVDDDDNKPEVSLLFAVAAGTCLMQCGIRLVFVKMLNS